MNTISLNSSVRAIVAAVSTVTMLSTSVSAQDSTEFPQIPDKYRHMVPEELENRKNLMSGHSGALHATALGMDDVSGKAIPDVNRASEEAPPDRSGDVEISAGFEMENQPVVVSNPQDRDHLVTTARRRFFDSRVAAFYSSDGGQKWSDPVNLPRFHSTEDGEAEVLNSHPVVAYGPEGDRVYCAYMDILFKLEFKEDRIIFKEDVDIVVSHSDDNGKTWSDPEQALDGKATKLELIFEPCCDIKRQEGFVYDKPWIRTAPDQANRVYITATRLDDFYPFARHITFTRSDSRGDSWTSPRILDSGSFEIEGNPVVHGARPAGGDDGDVLVAWYHSGDDGWLEGEFEIRTRFSSDHGSTWDSINVATVDEFETPYWLGPDAAYHDWWQAMFPDVRLGPEGRGHVVYTHSPEEGGFFSSTPENGDIRYVTSSGAPYRNWTAPNTISVDENQSAQGFAAMALRGDQPHVIWEDHRPSPDALPNSLYDIAHTRLTGDGTSWSPVRFISNETSVSSEFFPIGHMGITPIAGSTSTSDDVMAFGAWTDRSHADSISFFGSGSNIFGSPIVSGETP